MKILLLADAASIHTIRWANSISKRNVDILIFTFSNFNKSSYSSTIRIFSSRIPDRIKKFSDGNILKILYLSAIIKLFKIKKKYDPDLVHAFYASSYGLLGSLLRFNPFFISVWGSDIYEFPEKNFLTNFITKYVLKKALVIFSTSNDMKKRIEFYLPDANIKVIPFGVDISKFSNLKSTRVNSDELVIGTVKSLEYIYGIDILLNVFALLKLSRPKNSFKLLIVGTGSQKEKLEDLAVKLGIRNNVDFRGFVEHKKIESVFQEMDLCVFLSRRESFGVSVIEASASLKPIIASKIDGLVEVVQHGFTGYLVDPYNVKEVLDYLLILADDKLIRDEFGKNGRDFVIKNYLWENSVENLFKEYGNIINDGK